MVRLGVGKVILAPAQSSYLPPTLLFEGEGLAPPTIIYLPGGGEGFAFNQAPVLF